MHGELPGQPATNDFFAETDDQAIPDAAERKSIEMQRTLGLSDLRPVQ